MRGLLAAAAGFGLLLSTTAGAQVYVKPYVRSDGTFVQGHNRSAPNNTRADNWSTDGNYNPYTGQQGTQPAYPAPTRQPSYPTPNTNRPPASNSASLYGNLGKPCTYPCF